MDALGGEPFVQQMPVRTRRGERHGRTGAPDMRHGGGTPVHEQYGPAPQPPHPGQHLPRGGHGAVRREPAGAGQLPVPGGRSGSRTSAGKARARTPPSDSSRARPSSRSRATRAMSYPSRPNRRADRQAIQKKTAVMRFSSSVLPV
ncbi:hypothetical protein Shyhy01_29250 [Streptomyces hygroscopicus subsp. hygroscopicus]|nr:hypothetical protein Shyhy01_29250 [Streptomyces hygroscopicus subsp. hygroscopicus]